MGAIIGAFIGLVLLVLVFLVIGIIATRYTKVGPNQVLVVSGRRHRFRNPETGELETRAYRIVKGGGTFILPIIERVDDLSLEIMTIDVITPKVYTKQGVPLTVDGVAQVKIRGDDVSIATAAEQFLSKSTEEIKNVALQTLEGHLRAILGTLTVEEIYQDRDAFAQSVQEVAAADMANMGLGIVSFTIRDIRDDQGYLDALGQARTAEVKRDAEIGKALAERDARIKAAEALQAAREAEFLAQTRIAESEKEYNVQKANYDAEVNRKKAEAEMAYTLQQTILNQQIKAEEVQILVIEKEKQIEVQRQETLRREQELEATIRKPAAAEQYRIETLANAKRFEREAQALAEAAAIKATGEAEAEARRARGLAEAEIIRAQGEAEAEAMQKKAAAWQNYNQAAILQELFQSLPSLAGAIAQPLSKTERIVVVGGGNGQGVGVNKITQDVTSIIAQVPAAVEALTGIDILSTIQSLPAIQATKPRTTTNGAPQDETE